MNKLTREQLNGFAENWNRRCKESGVKSETGLEVFLASLNAYLFLCRQNGYSEEEYNVIKNALQDITDWYIIGMDIENFESNVPDGPFLTDRILIKLGEDYD